MGCLRGLAELPGQLSARGERETVAEPVRGPSGPGWWVSWVEQQEQVQVRQQSLQGRCIVRRPPGWRPPRTALGSGSQGAPSRHLRVRPTCHPAAKQEWLQPIEPINSHRALIPPWLHCAVQCIAQ